MPVPEPSFEAVKFSEALYQSSNCEMILVKTRYPWHMSESRQYSFLAW